jgi:hypothetical protein
MGRWIVKTRCWEAKAGAQANRKPHRYAISQFYLLNRGIFERFPTVGLCALRVFSHPGTAPEAGIDSGPFPNTLYRFPLCQSRNQFPSIFIVYFYRRWIREALLRHSLLDRFVALF